MSVTNNSDARQPFFQSYFPRWQLKTEGVIAPDERLPWRHTILVGLQHVVAMFG